MTAERDSPQPPSIVATHDNNVTQCNSTPTFHACPKVPEVCQSFVFFCEGGVDVIGVVTPLVRGGAQVLHGDQVVELSVLLEVHEKGEVEEDGEGQIEVEGGE